MVNYVKVGGGCFCFVFFVFLQWYSVDSCIKTLLKNCLLTCLLGFCLYPVFPYVSFLLIQWTFTVIEVIIHVVFYFRIIGFLWCLSIWLVQESYKWGWQVSRGNHNQEELYETSFVSTPTAPATPSMCYDFTSWNYLMSFQRYTSHCLFTWFRKTLFMWDWHISYLVVCSNILGMFRRAGWKADFQCPILSCEHLWHSVWCRTKSPAGLFFSLS